MTEPLNSFTLSNVSSILTTFYLLGAAEKNSRAFLIVVSFMLRVSEYTECFAQRIRDVYKRI